MNRYILPCVFLSFLFFYVPCQVLSDNIPINQSDLSNNEYPKIFSEKINPTEAELETKLESNAFPSNSNPVKYLLELKDDNLTRKSLHEENYNRNFPSQDQAKDINGEISGTNVKNKAALPPLLETFTALMEAGHDKTGDDQPETSNKIRKVAFDMNEETTGLPMKNNDRKSLNNNVYQSVHLAHEPNTETESNKKILFSFKEIRNNEKLLRGDMDDYFVSSEIPELNAKSGIDSFSSIADNISHKHTDLSDLGIHINEIVNNRRLDSSVGEYTTAYHHSYLSDLGVYLDESVKEILVENKTKIKSVLRPRHQKSKTPNYTDSTNLTDLGIHINVTINMTDKERDKNKKTKETAFREGKTKDKLGDLGVHMMSTETTMRLITDTKDHHNNWKSIHASKNNELNLKTNKEYIAKDEREDEKVTNNPDLPLQKDTNDFQEVNNRQKETSESNTNKINEKQEPIEDKTISVGATEMNNEHGSEIPHSTEISTVKDSDSTTGTYSSEFSANYTEQQSMNENKSEKTETKVDSGGMFSKMFINDLFRKEENLNQLHSRVHVKFVDYVVSQTIDYSSKSVHLYLGGIDDVMYKFTLQPLSPDNFPKKAFVWIESSTLIKSKPISRMLRDLNMYEGKIENQESSFAVGYIDNNIFFGALMLPSGKTVFIEPVENYKHADFMKGKNAFTYTGSQVFLSSCARLKNSGNVCGEDLYSDLYSCKSKDTSTVACFVGYRNEQSKHQALEGLNFSKGSFSNVNLTQNTKCLLELVSDSSYSDSMPRASEVVLLRDFIIMGLHANWIFKQLDLDNDGIPDDFNLQIGRIVLKFSDPSSNMNETMKNHLVKFRKQLHPMCASILFVSSSLKKEPVSYTYAGGICTNKDAEEVLPTNVAVINTRSPDGDVNVLFIRAMTLARTISQMMGTYKECEAAVPLSSQPDHWNSFFSECDTHNMARFIYSEGSCLINDKGFIYKTNPQFRMKSSCGNERIDPGEECDCGTPENCVAESSCCTPPGLQNECRIDRSKGFECDWKDVCCTRTCRIIPASWKYLCSQGEPSCSTEAAYCDGVSSKCQPNNTFSSAYNGLSCWPGPAEYEGAATCKDGFCNSTVCRDNGLLDCKCSPESGEECRVCCRKNNNSSMCIPIEHFGIRSKRNKLFLRNQGTICQEVRFGQCNKRGICKSTIKLPTASASSIYIPISGHSGYYIRSFTFIAFSILSRLLFFRLF